MNIKLKALARTSKGAGMAAAAPSAFEGFLCLRMQMKLRRHRRWTVQSRGLCCLRRSWPSFMAQGRRQTPFLPG
jgi:hypothetical protein